MKMLHADYSVRHWKYVGPENERRNLVIFHTSTETFGELILVVIPYTSTVSHMYTSDHTIQFIVTCGSSNTQICEKQHFCGTCKIAP